MPGIPDAYRDLFEKPTIAHIATMNPGGMPHVTPVWIDYDPETARVLVNTERGRQKERNVARDPKVGVSMTDPDSAYRWVSIMGEVVEVRTDGARDHIDQLSRRYLGHDYQNPVRTERVVLEVRIDSVLTRD